MAWPCGQNGGQQIAKTTILWRARNWQKAQAQTKETVQGLHKEQSEKLQDTS